MIKQTIFKKKIEAMLKFLKRLFKIRFRNSAVETNTYRLLRMNRKLSFKQGK